VVTGTGIVPPDTFTLAEEDVIEISIEGLGVLTNPVIELPVD
jgi:2-dehydro-3-deoxy-D-arabinonate dehydratase